MKKMVSLLSVLFSVFIAQSHEFWLQPKKFRFAVGEETRIEFLVGENFNGEPWDLRKNKIEKLELHQQNKVSDLKGEVKLEEKEKLKIKFTEEGTYVLSMQSNESFIALDSKKFNDYLTDEGLDEIRSIRAKTNSSDKPSRELYSRYAKLLLQTGSKKDDTFKKRVGFKIEIVPLQNPYNLKSGDYLQCLILFDGKALPHQLVKIWNIIGNASILQNAYTENDGTIKFPISGRGPWMISTVKMIESQKSVADWQSFWGSLTFEIE
ncbi:MAG TPA: hypothetical protein DGG95_01095 [Cytophagales bacterium]|jgi:uncharacterized GH25 family protein|nr:hypothetical protein [Cytophagales bacterium]